MRLHHDGLMREMLEVEAVATSSIVQRVLRHMCVFGSLVSPPSLSATNS